MDQQRITYQRAHKTRTDRVENRKKRITCIKLSAGDPIKWSKHSRIQFTIGKPQRIIFRAD